MAEIVRLVDGLPLAIELAASRLRTLSLTQLRDRLHDRFGILASGKHGRHATMRATLDWSWELLRPWEQLALAQASVFQGGFTLEAAEAVLDLSSRPEAPAVLDAVQALETLVFPHKNERGPRASRGRFRPEEDPGAPSSERRGEFRSSAWTSRSHVRDSSTAA